MKKMGPLDNLLKPLLNPSQIMLSISQCIYLRKEILWEKLKKRSRFLSVNAVGLNGLNAFNGCLGIARTQNAGRPIGISQDKSRDRNTMETNCGCEAYCKSCGAEGGDPEATLKQCSLHLNAQQTLNALKALGTLPEPKGAYCFCPGIYDALRMHTGECLAAQKAIKDSENKP